MEKICGIYKITSPSGRIYIGQSIDIKRRFEEYNKNRCKTQPLLYRSFQKYGVDNHKFEVIEECSVDELNERERYYQDLYDVLGINGLNCILTNTLLKKLEHSTSTRLKMSNSQRGKKQSKDTIEKRIGKLRGVKLEFNHKMKISKSNKGKILSDNHKLKLSIAHKGKKLSKHTREKMSKSRTGILNCNYGKKMSDTQRKKISEYNKEKKCGFNNNCCKYILNTETGIYYPTINEAGFSINYSASKLGHYLRGRYNNKTNLIYT